MDTDFDIQSGGIRFSLGKSKYDNQLAQHTVADFDEFQEFVLTTRSQAKGQKFIASAMTKGQHDNPDKHEGEAHWRLASHTLPRRYLPFDFDGFDTPETADAVFKAMSSWRGFGYYTSSSTPEAPRARVILELSREVSRAEGVRLGEAIQKVLEKKFGADAIAFDNSVYRGEQPVYTPVGDAESFEFRGKAVDVDRILKAAPAPLQPKPVVSTLFQVERLTEKVEYPPSSAITVASMCAQLARMRDMKGAIPEPEWRNAIGVIKHCVEGDELAHEWSQGDPRYDRDETQAKIDGWTTGPTTCDTFAATNSHACSNCRFKGKVKTPIQLGYTAEVKIEIEVPQPEGIKDTGINPISLMPRGYRWNNETGRIERLVNDEDGIPGWIDICDSIFYPTTRVQLEDGTWAQRCSMQVSKDVWREFEIPTKTLVSRDGLPAALAAYEVITLPGRNAHVAAYMADWLGAYKQHGIEINTFKHYGWHHNHSCFLFGDRMITPDGSERQVIRASNLKTGSKIREGFSDFTATGNEEDWIRIFNLIYNRNGAEHYQFTAIALMSSPLIGLLDLEGFKGIPVALTGDSGIGKTSVGKAAASAYGRPDAFTLEANSATINAFDPFVAGVQSMPCILDELTGRDPKQVSDKLYSLSNGESRARASVDGTMSGVRHTWRLVALITGNTNITESMRQLEKTRADASMVRIFEIFVNKEDSARLFADLDVQAHLDQLFRHSGHVGRKFVLYAMKHKHDIREDFIRVRERLMKKIPDYDTKERFFLDLIAVTVLAGKILTELGAIQFDLKRVEAWALNHILELREIRADYLTSTDDLVGNLIGWLHGNILVTKGMSKGHTEPALESVRLLGPTKARMVVGSGQERFLVSARAVKEWCSENNTSYRGFLQALKNAGYLRDGAPDRAVLTMGTQYPSNQERVLEFVYEKVSGVAPAVTSGEKVVSIR